MATPVGWVRALMRASGILPNNDASWKKALSRAENLAYYAGIIDTEALVVAALLPQASSPFTQVADTTISYALGTFASSVNVEDASPATAFILNALAQATRSIDIESTSKVRVEAASVTPDEIAQEVLAAIGADNEASAPLVVLQTTQADGVLVSFIESQPAINSIAQASMKAKALAVTGDGINEIISAILNSANFADVPFTLSGLVSSSWGLETRHTITLQELTEALAALKVAVPTTPAVIIKQELFPEEDVILLLRKDPKTDRLYEMVICPVKAEKVKQPQETEEVLTKLPKDF